MLLKGIDLAGSEEALDEGLWKHPLLDPETCGAAGLYLPVGPWPTTGDVYATQLLRFVGTLMRQDFTNLEKAFQVLFVRLGVPAEEIERRSKAVDEEFQTMKFKMLHRMRVAWGRRRAGENQPAPVLLPLPENLQDDPEGGPMDVKYPLLHVYNTEKECLDARDERASIINFKTIAS